MGLLQALQQKKNLTATEAMIADYILQNPEAFVQLSITELAKATYSSKAAITRMCQKLGQDGYKNFRTTFAVEMEKQRYERQDIDINYPFVPRESAASIMRSVNYISKEALDACYATLSPEAIDRAARTLRNANHIYLYGVGDTYITAIAFSNMLMKLGIHCVLTEQYNERIGMTYNAAKGDAALFLSYSGGIMPFLKTELGILRGNRCTSILISTLDACDGVDQIITLPSQEHAVGKAAGFYSQAAIRYALNCLYGVIYALDLDKNKAKKNRIEGAATNR